MTVSKPDDGQQRIVIRAKPTRQAPNVDRLHGATNEDMVERRPQTECTSPRGAARGFRRGGNLDTLLAALQTRQARRGELATMMAVGEAVDVERFDRKAIEARVRDRVKGWRELLTKRVEDGRRLLREALASPLRFTPEGRFVPIRG